MLLNERRSRTLAVLFLNCLLAACTHNLDVPKIPISTFSQKEKMALVLGLELNNELRTAQSVLTRSVDTWIFPLGENLCLNSELLARALFSDVTLVDDNSTKASVDAILVPKFISSVQSLSVFPFPFERKITVVLEWSLKDPTGNVIWIDTITGEGRLTDYEAFNYTGNRRRLFEAMLSDLFHRSYETISSSLAIRKFAATKASN